MADFVIGVVGDILRHVAIKVLKRSDVCWVSRIWLIVLIYRASELVVLLPEIGLYEFDGQCKLQKLSIAFRQFVVVLREQCSSWQRRTSHACRTEALQKFAPPDEAAPAGVKLFLGRLSSTRIR